MADGRASHSRCPSCGRLKGEPHTLQCAAHPIWYGDGCSDPTVGGREDGPEQRAREASRREERDNFLRAVVEELASGNERWPGLWTRLDSLLRQYEAQHEENELLQRQLLGRKIQMHEYRQENEFMKHERTRLRQERDGAEKAARQEADQYMRQLDQLREENARLQQELALSHDARAEAWLTVSEAEANEWELKDRAVEAERVAATLRQALEAVQTWWDAANSDNVRFSELEPLWDAVGAALAAAGDTETA